MTNKDSGLALAEAIDRAGGSQAALGKLIGVTQQTISNWLKSKTAAEYVLAIERATGVPRHRLRPDIYPPPEEEAAA
jgi:DNA-binding transcriptional regulator YdaS (Cro superfamily)